MGQAGFTTPPPNRPGLGACGSQRGGGAGGALWGREVAICTPMPAPAGARQSWVKSEWVGNVPHQVRTLDGLSGERGPPGGSL